MRDREAQVDASPLLAIWGFIVLLVAVFLAGRYLVDVFADAQIMLAPVVGGLVLTVIAVQSRWAVGRE